MPLLQHGLALLSLSSLFAQRLYTFVDENPLSCLFFFFPQHFVSERKYDEDLGKALRFTFDLEPLKTSISGFGSGILYYSFSYLFIFVFHLCSK